MIKKHVVVYRFWLCWIIRSTHLAASSFVQSTLLEKRIPCGRARKFEHQGFVFGIWVPAVLMPDVFDDLISTFWKEVYS